MQLTKAIMPSLLATAATARPWSTSDDEPLAQKSRITAFVVNDKGEPSVECWEIKSFSESARVNVAGGSTAKAHSLSLARNDDLAGVEILTWPTFADIWPPAADAVHSKAGLDIAFGFNLFNVQSGLLRFQLSADVQGRVSVKDDDVETHIFSLENGDDWFYFEDGYTGSTAKQTDKTSPFSVNTISGGETEMLRLRYNSQPQHRVVHKGACSFTGIHTDAAAGPSLTVQVNLNEDL
ncbi:hypothetical protein CBER1_08023 [Cercospora berteroae]|uniref:Glycoside hydrolase 131 catalytic N-terminal domain-containing protein n=1 Tax=Cercospora berteroae TaxID=357750 RepID=A0A2S6C6X9_9PEZI|nr:hypothetical protein CBER1_08023 [Cercospora berteroae]